MSASDARKRNATADIVDVERDADALMRSLEKSFEAMNDDVLDELRALHGNDTHEQRQQSLPWLLTDGQAIDLNAASNDHRQQPANNNRQGHLSGLKSVNPPMLPVIASDQYMQADINGGHATRTGDNETGEDIEITNPFTSTQWVVDRALKHTDRGESVLDMPSLEQYLMGEQTRHQFDHVLDQHVRTDSSFARILADLDGRNTIDPMGFDSRFRKSTQSNSLPLDGRSEVMTTEDLVRERRTSPHHRLFAAQTSYLQDVAMARENSRDRLSVDQTVDDVSQLFAENLITHTYERELLEEIHKHDFDANIDLITNGGGDNYHSSLQRKQTQKSQRRADHKTHSLSSPSSSSDYSLSFENKYKNSAVKTSSKKLNDNMTRTVNNILHEDGYKTVAQSIRLNSTTLKYDTTPIARVVNTEIREVSNGLRSESQELLDLIRRSEQLTSTLLSHTYTQKRIRAPHSELSAVNLDSSTPTLRSNSHPELSRVSSKTRLQPPALADVSAPLNTTLPSYKNQSSDRHQNEGKAQRQPHEDALLPDTPQSATTNSPPLLSSVHSVASLDIHQALEPEKKSKDMTPAPAKTRTTSEKELQVLREHDIESKEFLLTALKRLRLKVSELEVEKIGYKHHIEQLQSEVTALLHPRTSSDESYLNGLDHTMSDDIAKHKETVTALQHRYKVLKEEFQAETRRNRRLELTNADLTIEMSELRTRLLEAEGENTRLKSISINNGNHFDSSNDTAQPPLSSEEMKANGVSPVTTTGLDPTLPATNALQDISNAPIQANENSAIGENFDTAAIETENDKLKRQVELEKRLRHLLEKKLEKNTRKSSKDERSSSSVAVATTKQHSRQASSTISSPSTGASGPASYAGVRGQADQRNRKAELVRGKQQLRTETRLHNASSKGSLKSGKTTSQRSNKNRLGTTGMTSCFPYVAKKPQFDLRVPFILGTNVGKSHSVPVNLQRMFSLLKVHNPSLCTVCNNNQDLIQSPMKNIATNNWSSAHDTALRRTSGTVVSGNGGQLHPKSNSRPRINTLKRTSINNKPEHRDRSLGCSNEQGAQELQHPLPVSIEHAIGELEDEFYHLRMNYQNLLKEYESLEPSTASATQRLQLQDVSGRLREAIDDMTVKSDQITALRQFQVYGIGQRRSISPPSLSDCIGSNSEMKFKPQAEAARIDNYYDSHGIPSAADSKVLNSLSILKSSQKVQQALEAGI